MPVQTFSDDRKISFIMFDDESALHVGTDGITRIEAYKEAGEMGYILWFAVFCGEDLMKRVNGKYVTLVNYGGNEPTP